MSKRIDRRQFIRGSARYTLGVAFAGVVGYSLKKTIAEPSLWQVDPFKCTHCGRCATHCVLSPSAVKCVHAYSLCGYCDLCGGYLKPGHINRDTAAENQLCPTAAIRRKFVEEPYYEYTVEEALCIGCGKCAEGCSAFGNGSLHLQIRHNLCANCNECAIARACPSNAIVRVPYSEPYLIKGGFAPGSDDQPA